MPIVCGQPAPLTGLVAAPHDPRVVAATSSDGLLRVWRLGPEDVSGTDSRCGCRGATRGATNPVTRCQGLLVTMLPMHLHLCAYVFQLWFLRALSSTCGNRQPPGCQGGSPTTCGSALPAPPSPQAEPALELKSTVPCTSAAFLQQGPPPPLPANQQPPPDPLAAADSLALPPRPGDAAAQAGAAAPQPRLLGGYVDGSLRLFSVEGGVELVWALARHAAPVMAVAPHPRKPLVLTAARWGSGGAGGGGPGWESRPPGGMLSCATTHAPNRMPRGCTELMGGQYWRPQGTKRSSGQRIAAEGIRLTGHAWYLLPCSDGSLAVTDLHSTRLVAYVTAYTAAGPVPASPGSTAARKQLPANAPRGGTGPLQVRSAAGASWPVSCPRALHLSLRFSLFP